MSTRGIAVRSAVALIILALAGCGPEAGEPLSAGPSGSPHARLAGGEAGAEADSDDPPVTNAPDPGDRAGAASRHVACAAGVANRGWGPDFGAPRVGAAEPEGALRAFLDQRLFPLPAGGYTRQAGDERRVVYTYAVNGVAKVAVIVAHADGQVELTVDSGWVVETFATCDPSEFDPRTDEALPLDVWTDTAGERVPTSTIVSRPGPSHCGWQTVTFLHLNGQQYLRDPYGVLASETVAAYEPAAVLPFWATDTGYRNGRWALWLSPDRQVAYLVGPDATEAWPATAETVACR